MAEPTPSIADELLPDEPVPVMQQLLDNPFLLLFLGIAMPTVLYVIWGVMEIPACPSRTEASEERAMTISSDQQALVEGAARTHRDHLDRDRLRLVPGHVLHDAVWHVYGKQNLANEAYRRRPSASTRRRGDDRQVQGARGDGPNNRRSRSSARPPGATSTSSRGSGVVADPRARGRAELPPAPHVDGLAARLLAEPENINIQVHPGYEHMLTVSRPGPARTTSSATSTAASTITRW